MVWAPPLWLRKLDLVRDEYRWASRRELSPDERFRIACELLAFAQESLRRQAQEHGCSVSDLLFRYERATARLRARVT